MEKISNTHNDLDNDMYQDVNYSLDAIEWSDAQWDEYHGGDQ